MFLLGEYQYSTRPFIYGVKAVLPVHYYDCSQQEDDAGDVIVLLLSESILVYS